MFCSKKIVPRNLKPKLKAELSQRHPWNVDWVLLQCVRLLNHRKPSRGNSFLLQWVCHFYFSVTPDLIQFAILLCVEDCPTKSSSSPDSNWSYGQPTARRYSSRITWPFHHFDVLCFHRKFQRSRDVGRGSFWWSHCRPFMLYLAQENLAHRAHTTSSPQHD